MKRSNSEGHRLWVNGLYSLGAACLVLAAISFRPTADIPDPTIQTTLVSRATADVDAGERLSNRGRRRLLTQSIETIRLGQRVLAEAPNGEPDLSFGPVVDESNWRMLELRAPKHGGSWADVTLLRPDAWLREHGAEVGGTVFVSVPECGINGNAEVLTIGACPPIPTGPGEVVTGTFRHHSARTVNVVIEGSTEPIGTTPNHLFWSEDLKDFVRADDLHVSERVRTLSGPSRITRVTPRSNDECVFNIEVHLAHVYHVGALGALVHNPGLPCPGDELRRDIQDQVDELAEDVKSRRASLSDHASDPSADPASVAGAEQMLREQEAELRAARHIFGGGDN